MNFQDPSTSSRKWKAVYKLFTVEKNTVEKCKCSELNCNITHNKA